MGPAKTTASDFQGPWARGLRHLDPGYFALVMATGIVALAAHQAGLPVVARALSVIDVAAYVVLVLLVVARFASFGRTAVADLTDHLRGPGHFTWVAGTCVLGSQLLVLDGRLAVAKGLWIAGALVWLLVTYAFFAAVTLRRRKPPLGDAISGSWLLAVVATQAVALLAAQIHQLDGWGGLGLLFLSHCLFLTGAVLYVLIIVVIFYRFTFLPIDAAHLSPPYWINMGALAITTLTGATLVSTTGPTPLWDGAGAFLLGLTLLFWAFGTWWIPLLLAFGAWRHLVARYPLRYAAEYWGLVFPLGMYSVASRHLGYLVAWEPLHTFAQVFTLVAVAAWTATFLGLLLSWTRALGEVAPQR